MRSSTTTTTLPQLASQVPGFLKQVNKRNDDSTPLDPVEQYFDVDAYYFRDVTRKSRGSESSRTSSNPGLTSAGSVEDGSPSPSPSEESFPFEDFEQVKRHDDQFTVPQRELRPNGPLPYPVLMQLDNESGHNPAGFHNINESEIAHFQMSSLTSPQGTAVPHRVLQAGPHTGRGKRSGPLRDSEKTAQVRQNHACIPCRSRKVACDLGVVCSNCIVAAEKRSSQGLGWSASELCFRERDISPELAFKAIQDTESRWSPPLTCSDPQSCLVMWGLRFSPYLESTLQVSVAIKSYDATVRDYRDHYSYSYSGEASPPCSLHWASMPRIVEDLLDWARYQLYFEQDMSYQAALDVLVLERQRLGGSSNQYMDALNKLADLKCLYRIWRQEKFFCVTEDSPMPEELPSSVHLELRRIVNSNIRMREEVVLSTIIKAMAPGSKLSDNDRLSVWLCLVQLILMYRDIQSSLGSPHSAGSLSAMHEQELFQGSLNISTVATNLLNKMMVIHETVFGKKKPTGLSTNTVSEQERQAFNQRFEKVEAWKEIFCQEFSLSTDFLDQRVVAILGASQSRTARRGTRQGGRQGSRAKTKR